MRVAVEVIVEFEYDEHATDIQDIQWAIEAAVTDTCPDASSVYSDVMMREELL